MPKVIRINILDISQGHDYKPTHVLAPATPRSVFAENSLIAALGDVYNHALHVNSEGKRHSVPPQAALGSTDVFVNNIPVHRDGDIMSCGDVADNGSPTVFANGGGGGGPAAQQDPGETTGYVILAPVVNYGILQVPLLSQFNSNSQEWTFIKGCDVSFRPKTAYSPQQEEDSGRIFRNYPGPPTTNQSGSKLPSFAKPQQVRPISIQYEVVGGVLPEGLFLDANTGIISGASTKKFTEAVRVGIQISNIAGSSTTVVTLVPFTTNKCS